MDTQDTSRERKVIHPALGPFPYLHSGMIQQAATQSFAHIALRPVAVQGADGVRLGALVSRQLLQSSSPCGQRGRRVVDVRRAAVLQLHRLHAAGVVPICTGSEVRN